jgi:hypothetical protein
MTHPDPVPPPEPTPRPVYRWPRIALSFVVLFFVLCVLFMAKEVRRLKRDRAADIDMRKSSLPTNRNASGEK